MLVEVCLSEGLAITAAAQSSANSSLPPRSSIEPVPETPLLGMVLDCIVCDDHGVSDARYVQNASGSRSRFRRINQSSSQPAWIGDIRLFSECADTALIWTLSTGQSCCMTLMSHACSLVDPYSSAAVGKRDLAYSRPKNSAMTPVF